jgi:hypothetical protein
MAGKEQRRGVREESRGKKITQKNKHQNNLPCNAFLSASIGYVAHLHVQHNYIGIFYHTRLQKHKSAMTRPSIHICKG